MLGNNIKRIRKEKKISLNNLAKMAGISPGYLSDIENNNATNPTMDKLNNIANALGVTINHFLTPEEQLLIHMKRINEIAKDGLKYTNENGDEKSNFIIEFFKDKQLTKEEQDKIIEFTNYLIWKRKKGK